MSTYKFDWQDVVHGHIEVEAESGVEAESIFNQMSLSERQEKSSMLRDNDDKKITFVDFEWSDTLIYDEWEEWEKRFNH